MSLRLKLSTVIIYTLCFIFFIFDNLWAAPGVLSGKVTDKTTNAPIAFASVAILELKKKTVTGEDGTYRIEIPSGTYTVIVSASGFKSEEAQVNVEGNTVKDFLLSPPVISGDSLSIEAERDVQKISRYTMDREEIKKVPATMGDAMGAISTMAGIERAGFLGPLSIRGVGSFANRYFVDGILIRKPHHFGFLHSIMHNEFLSEIDVYSSAFPVMYGNAVGATIEMNTLDEVKKTFGYGDIGIISSNFMIAIPVYKGSGEDKKVNGYVMVGARYGYLSLILPYLVNTLGENGTKMDVNYYDYQLKAKYFLDKKNSITLLLFGASDLVKIDVNPSAKTQAKLIAEGQDPYLISVSTTNVSQFHSQSLLYTYMPSYMFSNNLRFYTSINDILLKSNLKDPNAPSWAKNYEIASRPNIYGLRDDLKTQTKNRIFSVKTGFDTAFYHYIAKGRTVYPTASGTGTPPDLSDPNAYVINQLNQDALNRTVGGYAETKLLWEGLEVVAGLRADYLGNQEYFVWDPRGMAGYTFASDTTIFAAAGGYSSFYQTTFYNLETSPDALTADAKPERAIHRSVGAEQKIGDIFFFKLEGYYNNFYQLTEIADDPAGNSDTFTNSVGKRRTYGIEFTHKTTITNGTFGFTGWLSYAYGRSEHKSNLSPSVDPYGDRWLNGEHERIHSLKLIALFTIKNHSIGSRFQYYTSYPYTPITGDDNDPSAIGRYGPVYGKAYSSHTEPVHRLDIRYSYDAGYKWGHIKWYVEIINVYNFKAKDRERWKYNEQYKKGENPTLRSSAFLGIAPNFGVEFRF